MSSGVPKDLLPSPGHFQPLKNWSVVLVEPLTSENVGAVARLCSNFSVGELRLVSPRCDWRFDGTAGLLSRESGKPYLDNAQIDSSLQSALADCSLSIGMTMHDMEDRPADAVGFSFPETILPMDCQKGALVFGREDNGLTNEECSLCSVRWAFALNPESSSLNLSQSVAICLALLESRVSSPGQSKHSGQEALALQDDIHRMMDHMVEILDASDYERGVPKEYPVRLVRRMLARSQPTRSEIKVIRGMFRRVLNAIQGKGKGQL